MRHGLYTGLRQEGGGNSIKSVILKLGSAEPLDFARGVQGFRETKMCNGEGVSLAILNLLCMN